MTVSLSSVTGDSQISLIQCWKHILACDTIGRELCLAILNSLLFPETDRNIHIGKQGYVFILPILRRDVSFLTSISVSTLGKVEFYK